MEFLQNLPSTVSHSDYRKIRKMSRVLKDLKKASIPRGLFPEQTTGLLPHGLRFLSVVSYSVKTVILAVVIRDKLVAGGAAYRLRLRDEDSE